MRPMRLALRSCSLRHCQPFHRLLILPSLRAQSAVRLLDENGQPFKGVQVHLDEGRTCGIQRIAR